MKKSSSKKFLWISLASFVLGIISVVIALIKHMERPSATVFEVTRAFHGDAAADFERFMCYDFPNYLIFAGIILFIAGIVFLRLHIVKYRSK